MIDTPIAVMSGARRGALAQRPVGEPLHRVADQHAHRHRAAGADQHHGERRQAARARAALITVNATIAPIITTSPCAKLMSWMMP